MKNEVIVRKTVKIRSLKEQYSENSMEKELVYDRVENVAI